MYYVDTSYIVKCYLNEPGSDEVLKWIEGKTGLCCSIHGRLELWSALTRHRREGRITEKEFLSVTDNFRTDEKNTVWTWLTISNEAVKKACETMEKITSGSFLRAADALHLACAAENGFKSVYSHDLIMLKSAKHFGVKGIDIINFE